MKPAHRRPLALIQLLFATGALAVAGGAALVLRPDGSWLRVPLELLDHTPFESFVVPGIVLALVIGSTQLGAGWAVLRHRPNHLRSAALAAAVLAAWIAAQVLMAGPVWIHVPCFVIAIVELMLVGAAVPRSDAAARKGPGKAKRRA